MSSSSHCQRPSLRWIATAAASGQSAIGGMAAGSAWILPTAGRLRSGLSSRHPQEGASTSGPAKPMANSPPLWRLDLLDEQLPYFAAVLYFAASSLLLPRLAVSTWPTPTSISCSLPYACWRLITVLNVLGLNRASGLTTWARVGMALPILILIALGWLFVYPLWLRHSGSPWRVPFPHAHVKDLVFWSLPSFSPSAESRPCRSWARGRESRRVTLVRCLVAGAGDHPRLPGRNGGHVGRAALEQHQRPGGRSMTAIIFLCHRLGVGRWLHRSRSCSHQ